MSHFIINIVKGFEFENGRGVHDFLLRGIVFSNGGGVLRKIGGKRVGKFIQSIERQIDAMIGVRYENFRLEGGWLDIVLQIEQFEKIGEDAVETACEMEACVKTKTAAIEAVEKTADMRKFLDKRDLTPFLGKQESGGQA